MRKTTYVPIETILVFAEHCCMAGKMVPASMDEKSDDCVRVERSAESADLWDCQGPFGWQVAKTIRGSL